MFHEDQQYNCDHPSRRYCASGYVRMLILTRRIGESLIIGDKVRVTLLGAKGDQVRIGINAPKNVQVHREEIYRKIKLEKETRGTKLD